MPIGRKMSQPAIRVSGLSKHYTVAISRARSDTLRDELVDGVKRLLQRDAARAARESFWALRDVTFDVPRGEAVGVIGRNGAGKSTLLKLLARITEPTAGRAEIHGRVGSLLEVGTGFDRELTGRENIYLSGAILGMRRAEIRRKFDDIVAFAEVERFIETPLKRYSSGMFLRLAFAVAAHLESEILLLDEVLAVGDANFQRRCLGKMEEVAGAGRTILFVSHNLGAIARFCQRTLWVDKGTVREYGASERVVGRYLATGAESDGEAVYPDSGTAPGSEFIRLLAVRVRNHEGLVTSAPDARHPFSVEVEYRMLRRTAGLRIGITLLGGDGTAVLSTKDLDCLPEDLDREPGRYVSRCEFPGEFLNYGHYYVTVGSDTPMQQAHFRVEQALGLRFDHVGGLGGHMMDGRVGALRLRLPWELIRLPEPHVQ
jgi:lipopolysaccharide transport system ATP-binding protein